jgi:hypothetical protein
MDKHYNTALFCNELFYNFYGGVINWAKIYFKIFVALTQYMKITRLYFEGVSNSALAFVSSFTSTKGLATKT